MGFNYNLCEFFGRGQSAFLKIQFACDFCRNGKEPGRCCGEISTHGFFEMIGKFQGKAGYFRFVFPILLAIDIMQRLGDRGWFTGNLSVLMRQCAALNPKSKPGDLLVVHIRSKETGAHDTTGAQDSSVKDMAA